MSQSFYEDAIQLLEEGIKVAPQRADLHASLGECYFSTVKLDRAIQEFQTSIRLEPSARSYALLGTCYRQLGRFDEAKKSLNEGLKLNPQDVACLYNLGYMESKQDNLRQAEELFRQALQVNPNHSEALYELASLNMIGGKYEEAVSLLQRCAQLTSKPARVYYKLTIAQRRLNRLEAAERDLKIFQTLSKDPPPSPYPFQRFFEYLDQRVEMSAQEKTEFDLQELLLELKQQPNQPRKLYLLAEAYLRIGQAEEAKRVVERLHTVSGGDYRTALAVGVLLARYRMYSEAIEHFQMALKGNPASDEAKYNLANAYFQTHEYPQALELLQQVSNAARNDDAYLSLLADIHSRLGHRLEATKAFQEAIALSPDRDQYYLSLALLQLRAGKTSAAEEVLRKGLARIPNSGKILWGMGLVSTAQGKTDEAEEYLKKCTDLIPEWALSHAALGIFYYATGQTAKVRETLNRYTELSPLGGLNVSRIQEILGNTVGSGNEPSKSFA